MYCKHCGNKVLDEAVICPSCGCEVKERAGEGKSKIVAWLLSFFFGNLGIHRFYMNNMTLGIAYLVINVVGGALTGGIVPVLFYLFLVVEGIYILTRNDEEFQNMCSKKGDL